MDHHVGEGGGGCHLLGERRTGWKLDAEVGCEVFKVYVGRLEPPVDLAAQQGASLEPGIDLCKQHRAVADKQVDARSADVAPSPSHLPTCLAMSSISGRRDESRDCTAP